MIAIPVEDGRRSVLFQTSLHVRLQSKDADSDSDDLIGNECVPYDQVLAVRMQSAICIVRICIYTSQGGSRKYFSVLAAR
jgi:hypothetical protein